MSLLSVRRGSPVGVLVAVGLAAAGWVQAAPISLIAQVRSVEATSSVSVPGSSDNDSDSTAAADFGPFDAVADSIASVGVNQVASAQGLAIQESTLGASLLTAIGEARSVLILPGATDGSAASTAESFFRVDFTIADPSGFTLSGFVDTQAILTGGADLPALANGLLFENLDTATILFQTLTLDEAFSVGGSLGPGNYRLTASASLGAGELSGVNGRTVNAFSSFNVTLEVTTRAVPEPATLVLGMTVLALLGIGRRRARSTFAPISAG